MPGPNVTGLPQFTMHGLRSSPGVDDRLGRFQVPRDPHRDLRRKDVGDALRISSRKCVDMFEHLLLERNFLPDQVAAMSRQQLQANEDGIGLRLQQPKTIDDGAVDGGKVGIVRLSRPRSRRVPESTLREPA